MRLATTNLRPVQRAASRAEQGKPASSPLWVTARPLVSKASGQASRQERTSWCGRVLPQNGRRCSRRYANVSCGVRAEAVAGSVSNEEEYQHSSSLNSEKFHLRGDAVLSAVPPVPWWGDDKSALDCCEPVYKTGRPLNVAVLVSGGVDSSVALRLLQAAGHRCTAFYLQIWFQEDFRNTWDQCPWEEDLQYVKAVCEQAGVELHVIPLTKAYWDRVVQHSIAEIQAGRTPNPDVWCNSRIKFGAFFDAIDFSVFDRVASGHYARVVRHDSSVTLEQDAATTPGGVWHDAVATPSSREHGTATVTPGSLRQDTVTANGASSRFAEGDPIETPEAGDSALVTPELDRNTDASAGAIDRGGDGTLTSATSTVRRGAAASMGGEEWLDRDRSGGAAEGRAGLMGIEGSVLFMGAGYKGEAAVTGSERSEAFHLKEGHQVPIPTRPSQAQEQPPQVIQYNGQQPPPQAQSHDQRAPSQAQSRGRQPATPAPLVALHVSADSFKDQTYFLSHLSQAQLSRVMFPLGCLPKRRVRQLAAAGTGLALANAERPDSQGICFLGKVKFDEFVGEHLGERPGALVEVETGNVAGTHKGFWFYTIGQRKGLGLSGGPWYVVSKDVDKNIVYISRSYYGGDKQRNTFRVGSISWTRGAPLAPAEHAVRAVEPVEAGEVAAARAGERSTRAGGSAGSGGMAGAKQGGSQELGMPTLAATFLSEIGDERRQHNVESRSNGASGQKQGQPKDVSGQGEDHMGASIEAVLRPVLSALGGFVRSLGSMVSSNTAAKSSGSLEAGGKTEPEKVIVREGWEAGGRRLRCRCKVRHGESFHTCVVDFGSHDACDFTSAAVFLDRNDQGLAPGQFAAFYLGDECLGSGVILQENVAGRGAAADHEVTPVGAA